MDSSRDAISYTQLNCNNSIDEVEENLELK